MMQEQEAPPLHHQLHRRVMACWLGKAVGGTLGMPYEGVRETLNLTYYDPVPTEMLPNDDLDLQVVYACLLDNMALPRVARHELSRAWQHIGMSPDEYGIAKRNLALGLSPPTTGRYDNPFTRGMGAAIRTELWACLAPGDPQTAVRFAYEDACMDHADEGIHAATFLVAIESAAFVESDRNRLLDLGLNYIPDDSELAAAIRDTRAWWSQSGDWRAVQRRLADRYLNDNFTDVVINLSYIVLGWLAGDSFGEAICIAVNCGQDTDCTGATLGALLGILDPDAIEDRWLRPIGRDLVLSPCITGVKHPPTLDAFTDMVLRLRERLDPTTPGDVDVYEPCEHLAIEAELAWLPVMPSPGPEPDWPHDAIRVSFAGNRGSLADPAIHDNVALVRYRASFDHDTHAQFVFASPQPVRVWFDNEMVIESPGGEFVPALHRTRPQPCRTEVRVRSGTYVVTAAIDTTAPRRSECLTRVQPEDRSGGRAVQWFIAFADTKPRLVERDYLIDPLRQRTHRV